MSYQVIARKFRPQIFADLLGQNHISQTLVNALKNERIPQALLFTGPRGTGKTSTARILAKALRCPNAVDFVPCGVCTSCVEIAAGRSTDVIEIDGASHNGVDSIRELREGVAFRPSSGHYKVYIIDEVHMLSTAAFNALLKTLEEPPAHVIFMLATTEVSKIPMTILSRCQRFDFRRISSRVIVERMQQICLAEGIPADHDSLWIIARQGSGSMRDALSLLDQVITFSQGHMTSDKVLEILGLADRNLTLELLQTLIRREPKSVLPLLERFNAGGGESELLIHELLELVRACMLLKIAGDSPPDFLELPDTEIRYLQDLAQTLHEEDLHFLFDMALKGEQDILRSSDPRLVLEMVLLRMAVSPAMVDIKSWLRSGIGAGAGSGAGVSAGINASASAGAGMSGASASAGSAAPLRGPNAGGPSSGANPGPGGNAGSSMSGGIPGGSLANAISGPSSGGRAAGSVGGNSSSAAGGSAPSAAGSATGTAGSHNSPNGASGLGGTGSTPANGSSQGSAAPGSLANFAPRVVAHKPNAVTPTSPLSQMPPEERPPALRTTTPPPGRPDTKVMTNFATNLTPKPAATLSASEKWYELVQFTKSDEPLLGAKLENLLFLGEFKSETGNKIRLQIPTKLGFLQEQLTDANIKTQIDKRVENAWGKGYSTEIEVSGPPKGPSREAAANASANANSATTSMSAADQTKSREQKQQDDIYKQVSELPKVKHAASVFNGKIQIRKKGDL